ncbi:hypothetical protein OH809_41345 [Streptomyces sp. NBC_00873]|nr:hypothetical protein OH809_41345 [Streptomyces sp. NBC_00873]
METAGAAPSYRGFRFPAEIISHAVWLYLWVPEITPTQVSPVDT